ncbi:Methionyl-tRNA formyltransferase, mitochondrial [Ooceraea biroi]|uniref:Methionyl-tRNA formyltransferase, mitochondrial n=1 Tax=Ooceraea biroi TaxID=2015173 RepID=A0A026X1M0_OOCBI|nr:Methionyl-tRNA formyltransferase, mitochondrial [Ooceraea biroi]
MLSINLSTRVIKGCSYFLTTFKRNRKSREVTSFAHCAHHVRKRQLHSSTTGGPWNVLFFGTDNFSVESLRSLYDEYRAKKLRRLEVVSVYKEKKNAVVRYAEEKGIIVNRWPLERTLEDFHIGIVVSFGHLIPSNIINSFPLGMLNVHASLLPRWRGAAPIIYSLINGDTQTGITIMRIMPKKFDIGDIVTQERLDIHADETLPELHAKLARMGANVLLDVIGKLPQVLSSARPQETAGITYAPKITSKISLVKWSSMTARNVYDLHRGLLGLYPLTTRFKNKTIKLFDVRQAPEPARATNPESEVAGLVRFDRKNKVLIVTCKGPSWISIEKVVLAGHSAMDATDFRNGFMQGEMKENRFIFFGAT